MKYIGTQFDLFVRYPQYEHAVDCKIMSVNDAYRGVGIAKALTQRTVEYMLEQDLHLLHMMCSSHYSALVCERLGMEEIYRLAYSDYLVDGRQPLNPAEPHTTCRLFGKIFEWSADNEEEWITVICAVHDMGARLWLEYGILLNYV